MVRQARARRLLLTAAVGAWCALPAAAAAQHAEPLGRGATVRVVSRTIPGRPQRIVKGRLIQLADRSVTIATGDGRDGQGIETFALGPEWQLQRLAGSGPQGGSYALAGALVGTAAMGALMLAAGDCNGFCRWDARSVTTTLLIGAAGGGVIGLVIGSLSGGNHWEAVQPGVHVALAPGYVGLRVEL